LRLVRGTATSGIDHDRGYLIGGAPNIGKDGLNYTGCSGAERKDGGIGQPAWRRIGRAGSEHDQVDYAQQNQGAEGAEGNADGPVQTR